MAATKLVQLPVIVDDIKPNKDRSWKLRFETRDLSGDNVALLADSLQGEGWLVFSPNSEVGIGDVPTEVADAGVKSPAARLRARLYIYWKATGGEGDFEGFYRTKIEQFIEVIDSKIPEGE